MYDDLLDAGVNEDAIEEVMQLINEHVAEERGEAVSSAMVRVIGWLLENKINTRFKLIGLAFAINRQDLAGYRALDDAAQGEGVSHTGIANWRDKALKALSV